MWRWVRHGGKPPDGRPVTAELVRLILDEETTKIRHVVGGETWQAGRPDETRGLFERVALSEQLIEFLTVPAYDYLPGPSSASTTWPRWPSGRSRPRATTRRCCSRVIGTAAA